MTAGQPLSEGFTPHDPLEDTESLIRMRIRSTFGSFTPHDPLEDTESQLEVAT